MARALGYPDGSGWFQVCEELAAEFEGNREDYQRQLGGEEEFQKVFSHTRVARVNQKITPSKWLSSTDLVQVISNSYNRPFAFISQDQVASYSYLSVTGGPKESSCVTPIYLHNANSHWYLLEVKEENGATPLPRYFHVKLSNKKAMGWWPKVKRSLQIYSNAAKGKKKEEK